MCALLKRSLEHCDEKAKYVIKIPLRLVHGNVVSGSETNKHCLTGEIRTRWNASGEMNGGGRKRNGEMVVAPRDKMSHDECFKQKLSISMNPHSGLTNAKNEKSKNLARASSRVSFLISPACCGREFFNPERETKFIVAFWVVKIYCKSKFLGRNFFKNIFNRGSFFKMLHSRELFLYWIIS